MIATKKGNEKLQELRKEFAKKALEDAAIAKYAADKEKMQKMRAEREQEQFDRDKGSVKNHWRRYRRDVKFASDEEAVQLEQQAEGRAKEDGNLLISETKRKKEATKKVAKCKTICQKQKDEDDALALEMQRRWKLRNEQLNADENERKEWYDAAKAHQAFLLAQAEEKKLERREERYCLRQAIVNKLVLKRKGDFSMKSVKRCKIWNLVRTIIR